MAGFFDKMRSGITEKAMEATIRSREAIESQQVKGKIGELEGQKKKAFMEIGEAVYAMHGTGSFDPEALTPQFESISAIDAQIREKEQELEEIHRKAEAAIAEQKAAAGSAAPGPATGKAGFCPNCGAATAGARFCPECGTKVG